MQRHPCHQCPDRENHARWAERYWRLKRTIDKMRQQIETRTGTVARIFDRVVDVLGELDYVRVGRRRRDDAHPGRPHDAAHLRRARPARRRVAAARAVEGPGCRVPRRAGLLPRLRAAARRRRPGASAGCRAARSARRSARRTTLWQQLDDLERDHHLPGSEPISAGLAQAMHSWARGGALDRVLDEADMAAGDFVRWAKQTIDLLDQLSIVAEPPVAATARKALDAVRRGIVAYSSV